MSIMVMMIVSSANICAQKISYSNSNAKQSKYNFSKVIGQTAQGFFVLRSNNGFDSFTEQVHLRSGSKVSISYTDKSI